MKYPILLVQSCAISVIMSAAYADMPPILSRLGEGYNTDKQSFVGYSCLKPVEPTFTQGSSSTINLGTAIDYTQLTKDLNVDISAKAGIGPFKASASSTYEHLVKADDLSQSFYYRALYQLPTVIFDSSKLSYGKNALNDFGLAAFNINADQFRLSCGDRFLSEATFGSELFVSFQFKFDSVEDKQTFNAKASASFGSFASVSADTQKLIDDNNIHGNLEIVAYQRGGDVQKLVSIFGTDAAKQYTVVSCDLQHLSECNQAITTIMDYASNDFSKQISYDPASHKITGNISTLAVSDQNYKDYGSIGITPAPSKVTPEIQSARDHLHDLLNQQQEMLDTVNHLLASPYAVFYNYDAKQKLESDQEALIDNVALLNDQNSGALVCYLHPSDCVATASAIDSELKPVDTDIIDQFRYAYHDSIGSESLGIDYPLGNDDFVNIDIRQIEPQGIKAFMQIQKSTSGLKVLINSWGLAETDPPMSGGDFTQVGEDVFQGHYNYPKTSDPRPLVTMTRIQNPESR